MRFRLLACDVLTREVCYCVARCPHTVDPAFTPKGEHDVPDRLCALLQAQIDAVPAGAYDAVLLAYGLCGNAIVGLTARACPLVVPRAHDCTTLFLGSKQAFREHFGDNPSQAWASVGYSERGDSVAADTTTRDYLGMQMSWDELVAQYGEENAKYFAEMLRTQHGSDKLFLLDVPETRSEAAIQSIRERAAASSLTLHTVPGSIRLIEGLLSGTWPSTDYLVVPPGHRIAGVYDWDNVVATEPAS